MDGDADWGLYIPVHRDPATGVVLAEIRLPHAAGSLRVPPHNLLTLFARFRI